MLLLGVCVCVYGWLPDEPAVTSSFLDVIYRIVDILFMLNLCLIFGILSHNTTTPQQLISFFCEQLLRGIENSLQ